MNTSDNIMKFVAHSSRVLRIATHFGWFPGARYTNLRDVRRIDRLGFLDIDWRNYNFERHLEAAKLSRPMLTVAQDVEAASDLDRVLDQAYELNLYADRVIIVPKDVRLADVLESAIPKCFWLGFSVPTRYGGTRIPPECFTRPTHLLGGRPDTQRHLATLLPAVSLDCNRFTLDAAFGDYFDGTAFRPHPRGGYVTCLEASLEHINLLWASYQPPKE